MTLFHSLADYLQRCELIPSLYSYNTQGWRNLSFYESYFSNYIEGTEFEIDEAEKIVFEKITINNRHQDSHDVLSVFRIVSDYSEMCVVPSSPIELINLLKERHALIMSERPEKRPGEFKIEPNKAGDTSFVLPEHVEGTFTQAFPIYQSLPAGLPRAIFMQFLVAEVHPHDDGNGRLSRIMLNAELVANEEHKIIIPTVHRESYLNGLRQATRSGRFRTLTKVFANMQAYTASIDWSDYGEARETLERHMADKLPDQGVAIFNREISKHKIFLPAG
jgi:Fic family protein